MCDDIDTDRIKLFALLSQKGLALIKQRKRATAFDIDHFRFLKMY